jgi:formylglycine-generating enzyme required for sulfatase activity
LSPNRRHLRKKATAALVLLFASPALTPAAERMELLSPGTEAGQQWQGSVVKLVWIPAGVFTMGSAGNDKERSLDGREIQVRVELTKGFWLGQHEVTQAEWQRVMKSTPWAGKANVEVGDNLPATYINWRDASKFCKKLTKAEQAAGHLPGNWRYCLPTEAQWEYACRAGMGTAFCFQAPGAQLADYAWFDMAIRDRNQKCACAVAGKKPNAWGLYDMHGNVWEWCQDVFVMKLPGGRDPEVTNPGTCRVIRGGGWDLHSRNCRSSYRFWDTPENSGSSLGFRVAAVPN